MRINTKVTFLFTALAAATTCVSADVNVIDTFDGTSTLGATGTITFDDWGFTGPNGRTYDDFSSVNGFGNGTYDSSDQASVDYCLANPSACDIGQMQHVITNSPDGLTPDSPVTITADAGGSDVYTNANVDGMATFYEWGYTSPAGSTFNNMLIDLDGDYQIAKNDMNFEFYNVLSYEQVGTTGGLPDGDYTNRLAFQPYALSDATGWCGSVLASHPNAHEAMAGQVTFDFAFDVYFNLGDTDGDGVDNFSYMNTEIVTGFEMRSYGTISLDITTSGGTQQVMSASAVVNNTDPTAGVTTVDETTPTGDPEQWHNEVSFMGADVLTNGSAESGYTGDCGILNPEWNQFTNSGAGINKFESLISGVTDAASCSAAGGTWQAHAFTGYAFILRADATRYVDYFDESVYGPDPMLAAVPVPGAVWLFGSGLVGLIGVARRRSHNS